VTNASDAAEVTAQRIDELLAELRARPDPRAAAVAEELTCCLVQLYGAGLERIAARLGPVQVLDLCGDPLVESLLLVHDLHPMDTETRIRQALERTGRPPATSSTCSAVTGLRRYARRAPVVSLDHPAARCEMCGAVLGRHAHVAALAERELRCVCRPCGLLFTPDGAGAGRIRTVPERYLIDPAHPVSGADWDLLQIPAMPVFLFDNSELGRVVACYPSPAGATESLLDLGEWARLRLAYPLLREPAADVEAVFVTRSSAGLETYLVPIDACFAVVGMVRLHWRGPDGGAAIRAAMTEFRQNLRARSRSL
jgi:hypothetical protein